MNNLKKRVNKYNRYRRIVALIGIAVNVALAFLMHILDMPLYLDTAGTILVSSIGGAFPGIMTAVMTNVLCSFFNEYSIYFMFINVLIAICTSFIAQKGRYNRKRSVFLLYLIISVVGGIVGMLFQWLLLGQPQSEYINRIITYMSENSQMLYYLLFFLAAMAVSLIDKGITTLAAFVAYYLISDKVKQNIWSSTWKQTPLTEGQVADIRKNMGGITHSLNFRISIMLTSATLLMVFIQSWISMSNNDYSVLSVGWQNMNKAAEHISELLNKDMIDEYVSSGVRQKDYDAEGYRKINELLFTVRASVNGMQDIYVLQPDKDCWRVIFDTGDEFQKKGIVGERAEYEGIDLIYVKEFQAGEGIEPLEVKTDYGTMAFTYTPVYSSDGRCVAYICCNMLVEGTDSFNRRFITNMIMAFSGFFALILGFGFWASGRYLVYPIGIMVKNAEDSMKILDNQDGYDVHIKELRKMNIHTGDEVEKLYKIILEMAEASAEQMRNTRMLAQTTARMQNGLIIIMADMVENRDSDTGAHVQKTSAYVRIILEGLKRKGYYAEKLTERYMNEVEMSAPLHDIGKINVSDSILNKPGKLSDEEYEIMKTHTTMGKKILDRAINTIEGADYLKEARNMAAYHHERWDGKGYPEGLHGQVIPLSARVMAVADVFDALVSPRVYKPAFSIDKALEIINEGAGTQFDPRCVEVFMDSLAEVKKVLNKYQEI